MPIMSELGQRLWSNAPDHREHVVFAIGMAARQQNCERCGRTRNAGGAMNHEPIFSHAAGIEVEEFADVFFVWKNEAVAGFEHVVETQNEQRTIDRDQWRLISVDDRYDTGGPLERCIRQFIQPAHVMDDRRCI